MGRNSKRWTSKCLADRTTQIRHYDRTSPTHTANENTSHKPAQTEQQKLNCIRSVLKTIHKCTCEQLKWQEMCTIGVSRQTSKLVPWGRGGPPVCPYGGPYELGLWDWLGATSSKGLETLMLSPAPWFGTPTPSSEVNKQWLAYTMLCASS